MKKLKKWNVDGKFYVPNIINAFEYWELVRFNEKQKELSVGRKFYVPNITKSTIPNISDILKFNYVI